MNGLTNKASEHRKYPATFPSDLLRQILVRLSAKSLFRLRSVCKKWLLIIDDSNFIKAHTSFNQLYSDHTLLVRNKESETPNYSFSLDSLKFNSGPQMIDATLIKYSDLPQLELFAANMSSVAFCNGLILVPSKKNWSIINPLTKECHTMCQPPNASLTLFSFGFGYDCSTDDYKVVRIDIVLSEGVHVFPTIVYSLKSDSWRIIKDFSCGFPWQVRATFLDGTLYWSSHCNTVVALDLSTERFCQLPLPHENHSLYRMVGLDGCLFCCEFNSEINLFDVWVIKDNGVEKSWSKKFSLQLSSVLDDTPKKLWVVAYLKIKEQFVLKYERGFLWCDVKSNCVKEFSIHDFPHIAYSQIWSGSLVRFNVRGSSTGGALASGNSIGRVLRKWKMKICSKSLIHGSFVGRALMEWKRKINTNRDTRLEFCVRDVGQC